MGLIRVVARNVNYCSLSCLFLLLVSNVDAHRLGESYLFLKIYDNAIEGRVEITLSDLNNVAPLDQDNDGKVSQEELDAKIDVVKAYVSERIKIGAHQSPYPIRYTAHKVIKTLLGKYIEIEFMIDNIQQVPEVLDVGYSILFEVDPNHRGLLVIEHNQLTGTVNTAEAVSLIFSPERQRQKLDLTAPSGLRVFLSFIGRGVWHIWIGTDHILFLVALVLPAVLKREGNLWEPVPNFRPAFITVVKIVTLFTIAHSITLSLAALGIVRLPSRFIESVIAISVVLAALNNLFPIFADRGWLIIFGFGLFHGFGFAIVLGHLGLGQRSLIAPLFGFNLGVEIGQAAIISITFPAFYALRLLEKFYSSVMLKFGSAVVALIALLWFIERVFELEPVIEIF